ncbi:hypothetical protein BX600DRAFT_507666 [Xylariales sp. PMI_506]|nr:hypothetical protein BX600DRAFT_507666 [Xylariales sp. PMI_506]
MAAVEGIIPRLPAELMIDILELAVLSCRHNKNAILELRKVCRLFNDILRPYALHTLQLEFTRLDPLLLDRYSSPPDLKALETAAPFCKALAVDLMLVRDEGETSYLFDMFVGIPSMRPFTDHMRERFTMHEGSFTELEFREMLGRMLQSTVNVDAFRLHLPFQLVFRYCHASTMLLGNTFEALAQRTEESAKLKTLVLENMSDTGIVSLWRNPQDVKNIIDVFEELCHLVMSVRRHEDLQFNVPNFRHRFWEMIGRAPKLESLCLIGLNIDDNQDLPIRQSTLRDGRLTDWQIRSIPGVRRPLKSVLPYLRSLELRKMEMLPFDFLSLFRYFGNTLKELLLNRVYLKTICHPDSTEETLQDLWVGLPNRLPQQHHRWIATAIREMNIKLEICRATGLGYDQYLVAPGRGRSVTYDFADPCGLNRSLEQRFVEVIMGFKQPSAPDGSHVEYLPERPGQIWAYADQDRPGSITKADWDAEAYLAADPSNNRTSAWKNSIDGHFANCNPTTLDELHHFANKVGEGMNELNRTLQEKDDQSTAGASSERLQEEPTMLAEDSTDNVQNAESSGNY